MKFSIRDLFLVTLMVALAVGWFVEHRRTSIATTVADEAREQAQLWEAKAAQGNRDLISLEKQFSKFGFGVEWHRNARTRWPALRPPDWILDKKTEGMPNSSAPAPNP
jgi:hypothetical protein